MKSVIGNASIRKEQQYRLGNIFVSKFQSPPRSHSASHPRKNSHKKAPRSDGRPSENQNTQRSARFEASHRLLHQNFASFIHITLNIHTTNQPTKKHHIPARNRTNRPGFFPSPPTSTTSSTTSRTNQPTNRDIYHRLSNPPTKFNFWSSREPSETHRFFRVREQRQHASATVCLRRVRIAAMHTLFLHTKPTPTITRVFPVSGTICY